MIGADLAAPPSAVPQRNRRLEALTIGAMVAFVYAVVLGGTGRGELDGVLRIVNAAVVGLLIVIYLLRAPRQADRVDRGVLLALLLFAAAGVLSQFPRQSFDAVLGALAYAAALFVARGELARDEVRTAFARVLMGLSVLLTFLTAALWLPITLEWWSLTGWTVIPPLDLNFNAAPWGHRHDLALLVVLLYPSLWIGRMSPARHVIAAVFGVLVVLIVILDGSRNLWLAILGSTAAVAAVPAFRRVRGSRRLALVALGAALIGAVVLLSAGFATAVVDRLLNLESLGWRSAMWVPLIEAWADHPIAGYGPGSFPWVLQLTDYFQTSSWAPRHPDNAVIQLLVEGGILGIAAVVTLVVTLFLPVLRGRSTAARWALVTFVLATAGANPTDFPFLVAVAIPWAAYAVPRDVGPARTGGPSAPLLRIAFAGGFLIVAVAYAMTAAGGVFYADARLSAENRDLVQARRALDAAIALDPGMALYPRQRGTIDLLQGDESAAIRYLELATRLNPSDDLAWRTLALAYSAAGEADAAESALAQALTAQRSDPANLLLSARSQARTGRTDDSLATLGEVIQSWPAIVGAQGWGSFLPKPLTTSTAIDEAILRWESDLPSREPFSGQGLWLAVLGGRPDLVQAASVASGVSEPLADATVAVFQCDDASDRYLDELSDSDRRTQLYWQLRIRQSAREGAIDEAAFTILQIMNGYPIRPDTGDDVLNPFSEGGFSSDVWGYRRQAIAWRTESYALPSSDAAAVRWLVDPIGAMLAAGVEGRLPGCR